MNQSQVTLPSITHPQGHFLPNDDGVTHINIYSRGKTELGRSLSHFAHTPFIHPFFGPFTSVEGFWYYIKSRPLDERLRTLWGAQAKMYGKNLKHCIVPHFHEIILDVNWHKCVQNEPIRQMMKKSTLPFDHYFVYGKEPLIKQVYIDNLSWLKTGFERIRQAIKKDEVWSGPDYKKLYPNGL